jgi:uncharacterized protein (TIGR03067 family)
MLDRIEKTEADKDTKKLEPVSVITVVAEREPLQVALAPALKSQFKFDPIAILNAFLSLQGLPTLADATTVGASITSFDQSTAKGVVAIEARGEAVVLKADKALRAKLPDTLPLFQKVLGMKVAMDNATQREGFPGPGGFGPMGPGGFGPMGPMAGPGGRPRGPDDMRPGGPGGRPAGPGGVTAGGRPPFTGPGGITPGGPGAPGAGGTEAEKKDGTLSLSAEGKTLVLELDLQLTEQAYKVLIGNTEQVMLALKGHADMAVNRSRVHDLAMALQAFLKDKGRFPQGTLPRADSTERGIPWRPDQRLSWAAELLPFFGEEYREWSPITDAGWNENKNLSVARRLVPHLLSVRGPSPAPLYIHYPGVEGILGATHFVGIAGVGLDAADYDNTNPKRGIFGYDRITKKEDVKDGLASTIALLQVPGDHKSPWLAGGGATVRGVSDDDEDGKPITPFVCTVYPAKPDENSKWVGKRGTIAIMGDGKVRFIPEDISAPTFRALCTIAGGETISGKLDDIAPEIKVDERELKADTPVAGRGAPSTPAAPSGSDQEKIQGTWTPVRAVANGVDAPAAVLKAARLTFKGNTVTIQMGGRTQKETFKLDPAKTPKEIDTTSSEANAKTQLGIYELSGNQLKVCFAPPGVTKRPTGFTAALGSNQEFTVLERSTSPAPAAPPVTWQEFTPKSKVFTVKFPGKVIETTQRVDAPPLGKVTVNIYAAQIGGGACTVVQQDLPQAVPANQLNTFFAGMKSTIPKGFGPTASVTAESSVTLGSHPGREWVITIPGKGSARVRVYLAGSRTFAVSVAPSDGIPDKDIKTFFDSFKLNN